MSNFAAPGWYKDPWRQYAWRWWDGRAWTTYGSYAAKHKPHLRNWASIPVIISSIPVTILLLGTAVSSPLGVPVIIAGLLPLLVFVPALLWLDKVEPEPTGELIHALLWGGTFAVIVSSLVNSATIFLTNEAVAALLSAPIVEEATKGAVILVCLKRRQIDGPQDAIIYALWAAIGFAIVENITYFSNAITEGALWETIATRSFLTVFAHPLFTLWIGLFIGLAVMKRKNIPVYGLLGYIIAVLFHSLWNGLLLAAEVLQEPLIVIALLGLFFVLLATVIVSLLIIRANTKKRFALLLPVLAERYGLTRYEYETFKSWSKLLKTRKNITRKERWRFDNLHSSIARLTLLQDRPGGIDKVHEQVLVQKLNEARLGAM